MVPGVAVDKKQRRSCIPGEQHNQPPAAQVAAGKSSSSMDGMAWGGRRHRGKQKVDGGWAWVRTDNKAKVEMLRC
jgi:hypothetical protein